MLPILLAVVVASAQSRLAPRAVLIPHRALTPDAIRAYVPVAQAAPAGERALPPRTPRVALTGVREAEPAPRVDAASFAREREQSAAQLADEATADLRDEHDGEAFNAATACLRRDPSEPECLRIAAVSALRMGHFDDARPFVDRCRQERPDDAQCLAGSAQLALRDRDLTLAGITIWRLSQVAPNSVDAFVSRAQLAELQGDTAAATRSYRAACEAGEPDACRRLGELVSASSAQ